LLVPALGAALFASDEPVGPEELAKALGGIPSEEMDQAIEQLRTELERSVTGLRLEAVAGGYQISTTPEVGPWVRQFFRQRNRARLSPAALETLAIVAYRQPVTAPEIQAIRGKDPSAALKTLLDKKLLRLLGRKKVVGNPLLYGTSKQFLIHFGLNSLEDLPAIEDFEVLVEALAAERPDLFTDEQTDSEESSDEAGEPPSSPGEDGQTEEGSVEPEDGVRAEP
jgi:segregation and condensation protein B